MTPEQLRASILQYAIQGKLVEQRPEEGTGEEDRKNQVISVKAAAQEKLWRFHVKNGVCLTGRADPKRSLTDKN